MDKNPKPVVSNIEVSKTQNLPPSKARGLKSIVPFWRLLPWHLTANFALLVVLPIAIVILFALTHLSGQGNWHNLLIEARIFDLSILVVMLIAPLVGLYNTVRIFQSLAKLITETQQTQHALQISEEKYRRIVETAQEGIWIIDNDNTTTFINQPMARMLGYTVDEMMGQSLFNFMDEEGVALVESYIEHRRQGIEEQFDFKFQHKSGGVVWTIVSTVPLLDDAENYIGALAMIFDITDRKQTEKILKQSEARLAEAQRIAHVGSWERDMKTNTGYWSDEHYRIFGLSPQKIAPPLGTVLNYIHPDDRLFARHSFYEALAQQKPYYRATYRIVRPDGEIREIDSRREMIYDEAGQPLRIVGIIQDITEQRQTEETLRTHSQILYTMAEGVNFVDTQGVIRYTNPAFDQMFGYEPDELLGQPVTLLNGLPPAESKHLATAIQTAIQSGQAWNNEFTNRKKDGTVFYTYTRINPMPHGDEVWSVAVREDITHRKQAEAALQTRLKFEEVVAHISTNFINLSSKKIDAGIIEALKRIARMTGAVRSSVFLLSDDLTTMSNTHEWCADPEDSQQAHLQNFSPERFGWYFLKLQRHEPLIVSQLDDLPPDEAHLEREWIKMHGFRPLLFVPMILNNRLMGALGFYGAVNQDIEWSEENLSLLQVVAGIFVNTLERKRAEEALHQSEERLQQALHISNIGIYDHDHLSNTIYWSPKQRQHYGWEPEEPVTLANIFACIYPENRERFEEIIQGGHNPSGDEPSTMEFRIVRRDGAVRWLFSRWQTFFAGEGQARHPIRTVGATLDVTEIKKAEQALRQSEANLAEAQQIAKLGNFEFELQPQKIIWSDEMYRIFGVEGRQEITLEYYQSLLTPQDFQRMMSAMEQAITTQQPYTIEYDIISTTGQRKHLYAIGRPMLDDTGQVNRIFGIVQDVTKSKQAEMLIRESEERFRAMAEANPTPMVITSIQDGKLLYVNERFLKVYGYDRDDIDSIQATALYYDPNDRQLVLDTFSKAGYLYDYEVRNKKSDGTPFWINLSIQIITINNEKVLFTASQDITERKQAEKEIRTSLQEKEILLKEIHHRVKNNMQIIVSLLELQAYTIEDKVVQQIFQESQQRIKSMALIHERLYQTQDLAHINFAKYVEDLTHYLLRAYGVSDKNIVLHLDISPLLLSIETAIPCGLIINELVSNAFKHAFPEGHCGQVWISLQVTNDHTLSLKVQDDGVGFPLDIDFRQTQSLGLSLIISLVRQLAGVIECRNEAGTAFEITFEYKGV